jgi:zinc D-Ala-D-Ala carboxypeptidase
MRSWPFFNPAVDLKLTCSCGCGRMEMQESFMKKMVEIRKEVNMPFMITSGYRCPSHNNQASSTGFRGPHTTGRALDIAVTGSRMRYLVMEAARRQGITRIGIGKGFIHLDDLTAEDGFDEKVIWPY